MWETAFTSHFSIKASNGLTYIFVGAALILFTITVLKPLIEVYMGGFIDIPT